MRELISDEKADNHINRIPWNISPLVLKPPGTRGGGIFGFRTPDPKNFRLRRGKTIIIKLLICSTARRRRKILRFCACKNTFSFAKTVFIRSKKQGISMKTYQKLQKFPPEVAEPKYPPPLFWDRPQQGGKYFEGGIFQGIRLIVCNSKTVWGRLSSKTLSWSSRAECCPFYRVAISQKSSGTRGHAAEQTVNCSAATHEHRKDSLKLEFLTLSRDFVFFSICLQMVFCDLAYPSNRFCSSLEALAR